MLSRYKKLEPFIRQVHVNNIVDMVPNKREAKKTDELLAILGELNSVVKSF